METGWFYAKTVNQNENVNFNNSVNKNLNNWHNMANAVGNSSNFAEALYTRRKYIKSYKTVNGKKTPVYGYKYNKPAVVTCHNFGLTNEVIPESAYIKKVTIEVFFKADKNITVKAPAAGFYIYGGKGKVGEVGAGKTGWHNGTYYYYPKAYFTTSSKAVQYVISGAEWNKRGYPTSQLYNAVMGIDLHFRDAEKQGADNINAYIRCARIKVEYDLPDYYIKYKQAVTDMENPATCKVGDTYCLDVEFGNRSKANGGEQLLDVQLPFGASVVSASSNSFEVVDAWKGKYRWRCNGNALAKNNLRLCLKYEATGLRELTFTNGSTKYQSAFIYPLAYQHDDYVSALIEHGDLQTSEAACLNFSTRSYSEDGQITYTFLVDGDNVVDRSTFSQVTKDHYYKDGYSETVTVDGVTYMGNMMVNEWELTEDTFNRGVTIESYDNNQITFNIPARTDVELHFKACFMIPSEASNHFKIINSDTNNVYSKPYTPLPYPESKKYARLQMSDLIWYDCRILTQISALGHIISCGVKDKLLVQDECYLKAHIWKPVNYIGSVVLPFSHFDPKSNFSNDKIKETYENKTYMGKKGVIEEDISLNIRLPPKDWVTLQGLTELDKPVPINANHTCFEGDPLNHRGWVELSKVGNLEKTNPLYYKGELEVDYLTHNINSRFQILKQNRIHNFQFPDLLGTVIESGDEFARYTTLNSDGELETAAGYFDVDTDGTYSYQKYDELIVDLYDGMLPNETRFILKDENGEIVYYDENGNVVDVTNTNRAIVYTTNNSLVGTTLNNGTCVYGNNDTISNNLPDGWHVYDKTENEIVLIASDTTLPENQRTVITLDNEQYLKMTSVDYLPEQALIAFTWSSTKIDENRENNLSRELQIVNENNEIIFSYEYHDFSYDVADDYYTCRVTGYYFDGVTSNTFVEDDMNLSVNLESVDLVVDSNGNVVQAGESEDDLEDYVYNDYMYGSRVVLNFDKNKLTLLDEGYNGREIYKEDIELPDGKYKLVVDWKNHNVDGDTNDVINFFDFEVQETIMNSDFANYYGDLYVSSFPVMDKPLLFTRQGQEGTLYYYHAFNEKDEFTYIQEPFYMYFGGVDLTAHEGQSLFNLNNSYSIFYLQNGLVRIGFNRLTGDIYLSKFDLTAKEYINVALFKLTDYPDFKIGTFSDDKMEIITGNTTFTMYRGHPYVVINAKKGTRLHDELLFNTGWNSLFAEQVNGENYSFPLYFDLANNDNLLPTCVGARDIRASCIDILDHNGVKNGIWENHDVDNVTITINGVNQTIYNHTPFTVTDVCSATGRVVYLVDGFVHNDLTNSADVGVATGTPYEIEFTDNNAHTICAVFVGDDDNAVAFSPTYTIVPEQKPYDAGSTDTAGVFRLKATKMPKTIKYGEVTLFEWQLLKGGVPVQGKTIEINAPTHIFSTDTDRNGKAQLKQMATKIIKHWTVGTYKVGAKFYDYQDEDNNRNKLVEQWNTVKIVKNDARLTFHRTGKNLYFTLKDPMGVPIRNTKITIKFGATNYVKTTNSDGIVKMKMTKKGTHKYKVTYKGNANLNKKTYTFSDTYRG